MNESNPYSLKHAGRLIPLQSTRHDHAALEALRVLGGTIISNRPGRSVVGHEVSLTVFALEHHMTLSERRLTTFSSLPRPVTVDYLINVRLPEKVLTGTQDIRGWTMPFLVFLAKVLNCDDGTKRPFHEWMQMQDELHERLLAAPPAAPAQQRAQSA